MTEPPSTEITDTPRLNPVWGHVELARFSSEQEAEGLGFTLESAGIPTRVVSVWEADRGAGWQWCLLVPPSSADRARAILAEEVPAEPPAPARVAEVVPLPVATPAPPRLHWVVGLMVVNLLVWIAMEGSGGSESRATLLRFGASFGPGVLSGRLWLLVTALFLHIGLKHLLANMASLAVLGPAVLKGFGLGRFYAMYLAAGLAGNLVSFALSPGPTVKAGASGAILGLLGILAGDRIREIRRPRATPSRFKTWHIAAMLVAFYGFVVGTGPADHLAHLGGLGAGIVLGLLVPRRGALHPIRERRLDRALSAGSLLLVLGAALLQALVWTPPSG